MRVTFGGFQAWRKARTTALNESAFIKIVNKGAYNSQFHPFANATYPVNANSFPPSSAIDTTEDVLITAEGSFTTTGGEDSISLPLVHIVLKA